MDRPWVGSRLSRAGASDYLSDHLDEPREVHGHVSRPMSLGALAVTPRPHHFRTRHRGVSVAALVRLRDFGAPLNHGHRGPASGLDIGCVAHETCRSALLN